MPLLRSLGLLGAAAMAAAITPALAEGNRLLPFWAQPYPAGYVQREPGYAPARDCRFVRRIHTRHGLRTVVEDRCRPVLHARD